MSDSSSFTYQLATKKDLPGLYQLLKKHADYELHLMHFGIVDFSSLVELGYVGRFYVAVKDRRVAAAIHIRSDFGKEELVTQPFRGHEETTPLIARSIVADDDKTSRPNLYQLVKTAIREEKKRGNEIIFPVTKRRMNEKTKTKVHTDTKKRFIYRGFKK